MASRVVDPDPGVLVGSGFQNMVGSGSVIGVKDLFGFGSGLNIEIKNPSEIKLFFQY